MNRSLALIVASSTILRLLLASSLDLGVDEAYYFTYAFHPDWNHFDHPPMVGWMIRLTTLDLRVVDEVFVRLPAIAGAAINTILVFKCLQSVAGEHAGITGAVLYNTSFYFGIISGLFILPDSVQLSFWIGTLYLMIKFTQTFEDNKRDYLLLCIGGLIGLATMSKVHSLFLWFGFVSFLFFYHRRTFRSAYFYIAILLSFTIASPILIWNFNHDFITWRFHGERVTLNASAINWSSFLRTTLGQILYANPFNLAVYTAGLITVFGRRQQNAEQQYTILLLWCSIPIIVCTTGLSLFRDTLPHWSGPGFAGLLLVSVSALSGDESTRMRTRLMKMTQRCVYFILGAVLISSVIITGYPGTLGSDLYVEKGRGDVTLDICGWSDLGKAFSRIREEDIRSERMKKSTPLLTHKWFPGGHLFYYVAYPLGMPMLGVGDLRDLHQFYWLNKRYTPLLPGENAYYVALSNDRTAPQSRYGDSFSRIEHAGLIPQYRSGKPARYWQVYRLMGYKGDGGK